MDAFSRSLAAAALVDGRRFRLPGLGALAGTSVAAKIDHQAKRIEPPRLEVTWENDPAATGQTLADVLESTGMSAAEATDAQRTWCEALAAGRSIEIGDLGALTAGTSPGGVAWEADADALSRAYWSLGSVAVEPLDKRGPAPAAAGSVGEAGSVPTPAKADGPRGERSGRSSRLGPTRVREASGAPRRSRSRILPVALGLLGVLACGIAFALLSGGGDADEASGRPLTVNQQRLNRSPSEDAAAVAPEDLARDLPAGDFDPASLAGGASAAPDAYVEEVEAVVVLGTFGDAINAQRLTEQIAVEGFVPYVDQFRGLTRVGATVSGVSQAEIEAVLARFQEDFTADAYLIE